MNRWQAVVLAGLTATGMELVCAGAVTLQVGGPGGSQKILFEEKIIPAFKARTGADVAYVTGNSTDLLAKLQAQRGRQELNVVIVDDGPMYQAIRHGFCEPLTPAPVYGDVYEMARFGNRAIGVGLVATGIAYNADTFQQHAWAAPRSWLDLTDPKFKQRFTTSNITATYGVHTLVMFARLHGGSEKNIDPGFDAIAKKLLPNVQGWASSPARLAEMFQNREVDIAVWGSSRAYALKKTGFPIEFVYPKEGAAAVVLAACPVVQNRAADLSQAFLQHLVSPQVQQWLATEGLGPTNSKARLDAATAQGVPYGADFIRRLNRIDWDTVNQKRPEWTNRWYHSIDR